MAPVAIIVDKFAGNLFEYIIPDQYVTGPRVTSSAELRSIN